MMFLSNMIFSLFMTLAATGSLFDDVPLYPQEVVYPSYAEEEMNSVSGNNPGYQQGETVAALEEQIQALMESNEAIALDVQALSSGYGNAAEAYLSSTIVDLMERVVNSKPFCKYVAYRTSYDDANAGTMVYGTRCQVSGSTITVTNGYLVEYYRYRYNTSSNWQYRYTVTPVESYTVNYGSNTLLYTNCLSGYPTLGINYTWVLIAVIVLCVVIFALRKGE